MSADAEVDPSMPSPMRQYEELLLDPLKPVSKSSTGSADSFFSLMDRADLGRRTETARKAGDSGEAASIKARFEWQPRWMQTCNLHRGRRVDVRVTLPDPCIKCQEKDGHGQKARVFAVPVNGTPIDFDAEFTKQQRQEKKRGMSLIRG